MAEKRARIVRNDRIAPDVLEVEAELVDPPAMKWRAGQFLSLRFEGTKERRSYSIASSPAREDRFVLLVKLLPSGLASDWFEKAKAGDELHFTGPMGFFVPDLAHAGDAVFAVTGSGIAAAAPMIEDVLARPAEAETGRVLLYWGLRKQEDLYWLDRLGKLASSPRYTQHVCLSRPGHDWTGVNGRITQHVLDIAPSLERPVFYLVGNGAMIRELKEGLIARGVDRKKQIRLEVFYPEAK